MQCYSVGEQYYVRSFGKFGCASSVTRPNEVDTTFSYENNRNLIFQVTNGTVSAYGYVNNAIGRRTSISRSGSVFSAADVLSYTYNSRNEVIGAQSNVDSGYNYSYAFDPIGNRLVANLAGTNWTYGTNSLNQYTQLTTNTSSTPTYDADGNMLTRDGWTQIWNGENRLIRIEKGDVKLEFTYDYMGRRVEKKVYNGEALTKHTRFVYGEYKLVEELDALNNNAVLRRYTWQPDAVGLDVPVSVYDAALDKTFHYHTDANKNITELTDAEGNVVAHYEYSPFGKIAKQAGDYTVENPFRFSSEYYDAETQLVYYNYRYYAPDLGRWLSRDPIGEKGGRNLYGVVDNNITNLWDIAGLHRVADCDFDYDICCDTCRNPCLSSAQKAICWANCMSKYAACLATATETLAVVGIVAGVAIIAGTIVEDIATAGIGIANDPATIAAGSGLIQQGMNMLK